MSRKHFNLSDTSLNIIKTVREENNFSSNTQALEHIIQKYHSRTETEQFADAVVQAMDKKYLSKERLRWALQTSEQNSIVILDILNTFLIKNHIKTCVTVETFPSPAVQESQNRIKEKLAHFKQASDERKEKHAENALDS